MNNLHRYLLILLLSSPSGLILRAQNKNNDINASLQLTRQEIREKVPEGLYPDFDKKVEIFLDMCSKYLTEQALITTDIPNTLNAEGLEKIDATLASKYGFNTKDLSIQFNEIINYINREITPTIQKEIAQNVQKEKGNKEIQNTDKNSFIKRVDNLLKEMEKLDLELEKYEKNLKFSQNKYLSRAKGYINISSYESIEIDNKKTEITREKGIPVGWYPSKYYLIKDIEHLILLIKELEVIQIKRQYLRKDINSLNNSKLVIYEIKEEAETEKFIGKVENDFSNMELFIKEQASSLKKMRSVSIYAGEPASTFGLYLALIIKDIVDVETEGKLVSKEQREYYRRNSSQDVLKRYFNTDDPKQSFSTHGSMLTFLASMKASNVLVQTLFTKDIVASSMLRLERYLYGTGSSLIRGIAIHGIPLAISGVLSQATGITIAMNKELFSDNEEIQKAALDYAQQQFTSRRISNMVVSYTASGFLWSKVWQAKDYFGLSNHLAKKKKCLMMHDELIQEIKNYRQQKAPNTKWQKITQGSKNFASFTLQNFLIIKTGDIIDGYLMSGLLFPIDTKPNDSAWINLVTVEIDQFNKAIINATDPLELESIYSKFNDYIILEQIVNIFKARSEIVKTCLSLNKETESLEAMNCLNNFSIQILSKGIKDPNSVFIDNLLAVYTTDEKTKKEYSEKAEQNIGTDNSNIERREVIANRLFADPANDKLNKEEIYKKADLIVQMATISDSISNAESLALMNIRNGNLDKSKTYLRQAMSLGENETLPPILSKTLDAEIRDKNIKCEELYKTYKNLFDVVFPDVMQVTMMNNDKLVGYFVLRQKILVNIALLTYNRAKVQQCKNMEETMKKLEEEYSPYFNQPSDLANTAVQIFFNNIK